MGGTQDPERRYRVDKSGSYPSITGMTGPDTSPWSEIRFVMYTPYRTLHRYNCVPPLFA